MRVVVIDRLYWSSVLAIALGAVRATAYVSSLSALANEFTPGSVAGLISAAMNMHLPLTNSLWALCILGQTAPAMRRILEVTGFEKRPRKITVFLRNPKLRKRVRFRMLALQGGRP